MRILVDTNILFSALLFPRSKPAQAVLHVVEHYEMVLSCCNYPTKNVEKAEKAGTASAAQAAIAFEERILYNIL